MNLPRKNKLEYEFLPEAIEIIETPASPLGRIILWLIVALMMIAAAWSYFGKIDIVATARGKIVPVGDIKTIKPITSGTIKAIKVSEGQIVKKGQSLIELDATASKADEKATEQALVATKLERDVTRQLASGGSIEDILANSSANESTKSDMRLLASSKTASLGAKQKTIMDTKAYYEAQLQVQNTQLSEAKNTLDKAIAQETQAQADYEHSTGIDKVLAESRLNNTKTATANAHSKVDAMRSQITDTEHNISQAQNSVSETDSDASATMLSSVVELDKKITELEQSLIKVKQGSKLQVITAPVDGTILSISSNTLGSAINAGQPLIVIVPRGTKLIVEGFLQNKDIGFVNIGQHASIKIDAFPFQKYGYLNGSVSYVSSDSFENENQGSTYKTKFTLEKTNLTNQGKSVHINPGMAVTAEIKTGERRIIEFLLEPIVKYTSESMQVR